MEIDDVFGRGVATSIAIAYGGGTLTTPSSGAPVTFAVGSETFRVALTTTDQVAAARAAPSGGRARIPIGRVVSGTQINAGWSWHLEDVTFTEIAIDLCDGRPSDVERVGIQFGGGQFCPWSDCGTDRLTWVSHHLPVTVSGGNRDSERRSGRPNLPRNRVLGESLEQLAAKRAPHSTARS